MLVGHAMSQGPGPCRNIGALSASPFAAHTSPHMPSECYLDNSAEVAGVHRITEACAQGAGMFTSAARLSQAALLIGMLLALGLNLVIICTARRLPAYCDIRAICDALGAQARAAACETKTPQTSPENRRQP